MARHNNATDACGLDYFNSAATNAPSQVLQQSKSQIVQLVGSDTRSSLKLAILDSTDEEYRQDVDLDYVTLAKHCQGKPVWRNNEQVPAVEGAIGMFPFEASSYRFEGCTRLMHAYLPFTLVKMVCESLFNCELTHEQLWIPMGAKDEQLSRTMIAGFSPFEPTDLLLDSWALILAETLLRRFSSHAKKRVRSSYGKISSRGIAHVIDYIEANLEHDLRLTILAKIAAMSVYHFARRFKETVGLSPHAYVMMRRVRRAQAMLGDSASPLAQVAGACGFCNQAHLTTAFKYSLGVTPGRYRRSLAL